MLTVLKNVRPWAQSTKDAAKDFYFSNGTIAAVCPTGSPVPEEFAQTVRTTHTGAILPAENVTVVDGQGWVLIPSFSDAHAHLDSNRLDLPFRRHTADSSLESLIDNDLKNWRQAEKPVAWRAQQYVKRAVAFGATFINTHAQVDPYSGLDRLQGICQAKENQAGRVRIRITAFPQAGIVRADTRDWSPISPDTHAAPGTTAALLDRALENGADAIGGLDPCGYDRDPVTHLDTIFSLAEKHGCDLDIHLHESGTLGAFTLNLIAQRTVAAGLQGKVTVSHAFALTSQPSQYERDQLLETLANANISVTTVAPARATLDPRLLRRFGIRVGLGQDGMRDYWSPYGNADMLDRTWQMCNSLGLRFDDDIDLALQCATLGGRAVADASYTFDPATRGLGVGDPADVVAIQGETTTSVIMDRPSARLVFFQGNLVARDCNFD